DDRTVHVRRPGRAGINAGAVDYHVSTTPSRTSSTQPSQSGWPASKQSGRPAASRSTARFSA
ncbi:MAG: hypothetical protein BRD30_00980, partial [Bacteroidetes bacterium QH_2_63_10]